MIKEWIFKYRRLLLKDTMTLIDEDDTLIYYICNKCGSVNVYIK